jgi:signal transduction histidine kinase/ActR/RegA family two-component response regulator
MRARLRRTRLGVKLAWMSALLAALVVGGTLVALNVANRRTARAAVAAELGRDQRTLLQLQRRDLDALDFEASLLAQTPVFNAALSSDRTERNNGATFGPTSATARQNAQHRRSTVEDVLGELLPAFRADVMLVTDDRGHVFAAVGGRGEHGEEPLPTVGTDLSRMEAVRRALDPAAPADEGTLAILEAAPASYQVAVAPLVVDGYTAGAVLIGQRLESGLVASAQHAFDGSVVVTAGNHVLAGDHQLLGSASASALPRAAIRGKPASAFIGGREVIAAALPLGQTQNGAEASLWLVQPLDPLVTAMTSRLTAQFAIIGLIAVLLAALGAALVARSVLRPLDRFVEYLRSGPGSTGDVHRFELAESSPEMRALDESFMVLMNSLAGERRRLESRTTELAAANTGLREEVRERERVEQALRESEAQLRQSQKLEAIGTLAGGVAHDFNNLLTVISGYTQLALIRAAKGANVSDDLRQVVDATDRAANLTHQLLAFSRKQVLQPVVLDLADVVTGVAPMLRRLIGETITLEIDTPEQPLPRVRADRGQLEQVIINLAVNARDAMPEGGTLRISAEEAPGASSEVLLCVSDTGVGIPPEIRDRLFEPFFTTKAVGKGTGLGLSTVYGIVKQSGGSVDVQSEPGLGSTFTIMLPTVEAVGYMSDEDEGGTELAGGSETVLLVEDEDVLRALARRTLEERGYTVIAAADAAEALHLADSTRVDVLLTDIVMPGLSGPQLADRVRSRRPKVAVVYMSGYADDALANFELDERSSFLRKPFAPAALARVIREAADTVHAEAAQHAALAIEPATES